jgi:hydroxylaminobenzene mutase
MSGSPMSPARLRRASRDSITNRHHLVGGYAGIAMTFFTDGQRRLVWHGMFLFLLGLLIGLAEGLAVNPRMALAAHLEGLMNGTFLIALGMVWPFLRVSPTLTTVAYWTMLYGTYANVIVTTFAAVVGASSLSPITGAGHKAAGWQESLVTAGFATVAIAMVISSVLILWGLGRSQTAGR